MLHFIIGRPGCGKTRRIREEIIREIAETDRPVVVLVPEQQTVMWETAMARLLPPSANLRMEITNFTRLANSVFREYGGLSDTVIDEGSRILILWRAMLSVWDELEVYRTPDTKNGREDRNLPRLMRAVDDFKAAGITPAQAEEALDALIRQREEEGDTSESAGDLISRCATQFSFTRLMRSSFMKTQSTGVTCSTISKKRCACTRISRARRSLSTPSSPSPRRKNASCARSSPPQTTCG